MNDTTVTLQGWLGSNVSLRRAGESDTPVASFRLACTPRRFHRSTNAWVDDETQWYTVNAWRALATNCGESLRRGDAVVVHGRLEARTWTNQEGVEVFGFEIEAGFVGHDLNRGTSIFTRPQKAVAVQEAAPEGAIDKLSDSHSDTGPAGAAA